MGRATTMKAAMLCIVGVLAIKLVLPASAQTAEDLKAAFEEGMKAAQSYAAETGDVINAEGAGNPPPAPVSMSTDVGGSDAAIVLPNDGSGVEGSSGGSSSSDDVDPSWGEPSGSDSAPTSNDNDDDVDSSWNDSPSSSESPSSSSGNSPSSSGDEDVDDSWNSSSSSDNGDKLDDSWSSSGGGSSDSSGSSGSSDSSLNSGSSSGSSGSSSSSSSSSSTSSSNSTSPTSSGSSSSSPDKVKSKPKGNKYDYADVLEKSLIFYEAQRSGKLPSDNRVDWRGDSLMADEYEGDDLVGGYFDAGDHLKITFPLAFSMAQLAWGILEFESEYEKADQLNYAKEALKWGLDWLLKAHVDDDKLVVMVGDKEKEHKSWGRPEDNRLPRPAIVVDKEDPGSDAWAATAAALAAGSIVFRDDKDFAKDLADHAEELYNLAIDDDYKYTLANDALSKQEGAAELYKSTRADDDIAWAGMWLFEATGDKKYKEVAEKEFAKALQNNWVYVDIPSGGSCNSGDACYWSSTRTWNWDNAYPGAMVLLAGAADKQNSSALWNEVDKWLSAWVEGDAVIHGTDKGLTCLGCPKCTWGANRDAANAALLALIASKYAPSESNKDKYRCFAQKQIDYMLGDAGRSLVVGFGDDPPNMPHHRGASCPDAPNTCSWDDFRSTSPNPHVLEGALVSGSCSDNFKDDRQDYKTNEVALDKNAGFTGAVAALTNSKYRC